MWSKIKNLLIFVVLGGILVVGYVFFMQKPKEAALVSNTTQSTKTDGIVSDKKESSQLNQDFLGLLFSVKSINLDASVLQTESFNSLKDSSIILVPDGTEGRPNPFAPIGEDNMISSQQAADYLLSNTPVSQNQTDLVSPNPNTNTSNPSTTPATAPKNKN